MSVHPSEMIKHLKIASKYTSSPETPDSSPIFSSRSSQSVVIPITASKPKKESGEIEFNFLQAGRALFITVSHTIIGPISIPILRCIFGSHLIKNMFYRCSSTYVVSELGSWLWLAMTLGMLAMGEWKMILLGIITVGIVVVIRTLMVSLKYGYYSSKEWKRINKKTFPVRTLKKNLLIKSWLKVPPKMAKSEVELAFFRQNVNVQEATISFANLGPRVTRNLIEFSDEESLIDSNGSPLLLFAQYLVIKSSETMTHYEKKVMNFLAFMYALIPFPLIYYKHGQTILDLPILSLMYLTMGILPAFHLCRSFLLFILIGVTDFDRKIKLMHECTAMISEKKSKVLIEESPKISLNSQDVLSWYFMRTAFLDLGKRFNLRVFLYASLILPLCLGAIVAVFLMMFRVISTVYGFLFVPGVYLVIVVMGLLCMMVSTAVTLNSFFAVHRDNLLNLITAIRQSSTHNDRVIDTLWTVIEKLKQDEILRPVKIMGICLDSSLNAKFATIAISGFFALLRVFYMA